MRTREEYKEAEIASVIVENKPVIAFNYRALTEAEKKVIDYLYHAKTAQSNFEIDKYAFPLHRVKYGETISYTSVRRMLEDLVAVGWLGKRIVGSRTLYYLTAETAKKYEEK